MPTKMHRRLYLLFLLLLSPSPEIIPCLNMHHIRVLALYNAMCMFWIPNAERHALRRNMHHIRVLDLSSPRAPLPHVINNLGGVSLTTSSSVFNFLGLRTTTLGGKPTGHFLLTAYGPLTLGGLRTTSLDGSLLTTSSWPMDCLFSTGLTPTKYAHPFITNYTFLVYGLLVLDGRGSHGLASNAGHPLWQPILMIRCSNINIGYDMGFVQVPVRFQDPWIPGTLRTWPLRSVCARNADSVGWIWELILGTVPGLEYGHLEAVRMS
ncbi:uncharacterized protein EI90DRAFT_3288349 [Cantharellus anzutake]|uniref:uncharacterized protein n=1 Tax=Cantharellus anzutake TaxID=1750568 RepID=UPI001907DC40|nr:uncharacterized protein EI90DRAFT_3288349 [Cantharellus anzutake]KAF8334097.1 hypothetical protein EI90DRAFT_3288349 [Cantharellus anzutake]